MAELKQLVKFLDEYLDISGIKDDSWNGLQVEGAPEVKKIVFAVDAALDTFKKAADERAEMVVVHHGHFWKSENPSVTKWGKKRIDFLLKNGISLYAAHLPLDRHKVVGNNAGLLKLLGAKIKEPFLEEDGKNVGWIGELPKPVPLKDIEKKLASELSTKCTVLPFGKESVKTIAVCSGGGSYSDFFEALKREVDLYLTGDSIEVYLTAKDAGLNVIFSGHHATETLGVQALAKVVRDKFRVETIFVDVPTKL